MQEKQIALEIQVKSKSDDLLRVRAELEQLSSREQELSREIAKAKTREKELAAKIEDLNAAERKTKSELEECGEKEKEYRISLEKREKKAEQLQSKLETRQKAEQKLQAELATLESENKKLKEGCAGQAAKIGEWEKAETALKELKRAEQNSEKLVEGLKRDLQKATKAADEERGKAMVIW